MKTWKITMYVEAYTAEEAEEIAAERLNAGGDTDETLDVSGEVTIGN